MKQQDLGLNLSKRRTRKAVFLDEMNLVVQWSDLLALIAPHAPRAKTGRPPFELENMLRIHFVQQWFGLSDLAMEEALFETALYREFVGLGSVERIPDRVSILRFRHLLEEHQLAEQILATVNATLTDKGLMLREGTVVDAMRPGKRRALDKSSPMGAILDRLEQAKARIRAKVEHPFRVIKRQFGYTKVKYRGLAKNTTNLVTLFALSNLWMARHSLLQRLQG